MRPELLMRTVRRARKPVCALAYLATQRVYTSVERHAHCKPGSTEEIRGYCHLSVMRVDNLVADMQTQAESLAMISGFIRPERQKYFRDAILRYRDSVVPNVDHKIVQIGSRCNAYRAGTSTSTFRLIRRCG